MTVDAFLLDCPFCHVNHYQRQRSPLPAAKRAATSGSEVSQIEDAGRPAPDSPTT